MTPAQRRSRGDGGLVQRHDHPTCPPLIETWGWRDVRTGERAFTMSAVVRTREQAQAELDGWRQRDAKGKRPDLTDVLPHLEVYCVESKRAPHRCQGRWVGTIDTRVDGRVKRKYVYGRTQQIARRKLSDAVKARDAGTLVIGTTTVEAWLTKWLDRQARKLKPQTVRGYRSKVRTYLIPHLGRHRLTALRATHIDAMYDALRDTGLEEATVRQTHAILGKALRDAERGGLIGVNPMARVEAPTTKKNKRAQLTPAEASRVLASTDDARWWLALFYGMRQGECLGLRWSDVDLDRHTLTITQTLQTAEDGSLFFDTPKSDASARVLPLVPLMEARLLLAWELQAHSESVQTLVFARDDGKPIRPRDDWQAWRDLLAEVGVPVIALHAARNSAATLMEAAGVPDRLAAQILGHSSVQITHGYQTSDLSRMASAFDAMGKVLELS
jgi:integrase